MKDSKSSDVQSPLNDQEKGVGFVLIKNAVMKNAKGNYHSFSKEKAASTSDGSNFTYLGIVIILALMKFGPEIMDNLNSKQKRTMSDVLQNVQVAKKWDPSINHVERWEQHLANNPLVLKKFVPDNDSQLLNQSNQNERLSATLKKQNQDIKNAIKEQNEILEYLEGRENNRQVRERLKIFGNFLLNLRL